MERAEIESLVDARGAHIRSEFTDWLCAKLGEAVFSLLTYNAHCETIRKESDWFFSMSELRQRPQWITDMLRYYIVFACCEELAKANEKFSVYPPYTETCYRDALQKLGALASHELECMVDAVFDRYELPGVASQESSRMLERNVLRLKFLQWRILRLFVLVEPHAEPVYHHLKCFQR